MDINIDQGTHQGNLGRFDDGKYLYKLDSGKFDIDRFNRDFDQYRDKRKEESREILNRKLEELNKPPDVTPPYDLSVGQIMINMKDATFNVMDDIINFKFTSEVLLKQNRLFYIGLLLIIIALILYAYMIFMTENTECCNDKLKVQLVD